MIKKIVVFKTRIHVYNYGFKNPYPVSFETVDTKTKLQFFMKHMIGSAHFSSCCADKVADIVCKKFKWKRTEIKSV